MACRFPRPPAPQGRKHLQFDLKVGAQYLTLTGRLCRLMRVRAVGDGDVEACFVYLDKNAQGETPERGSRAVMSDGFDLREGVAARCLVRVG